MVVVATKSVNEVTVIDTPECLRAMATFCGISFLFCRGVRLFHASTITNMSSTPRPEKEKCPG